MFGLSCLLACMFWGSHPRVVIEGIERVESNFRVDARGSPNDVGILQITPIMVAECNRIVGESRFKLSDRLDKEKSEQMFWAYSAYWAERSKDWTFEGIARRWNGGPDGHRKPATRKYWDRVSAGYWDRAGSLISNVD